MADRIGQFDRQRFLLRLRLVFLVGFLVLFVVGRGLIRGFGDDEAVAKDTALLKSVDRISGKAKSAKYKKSAKQFLSKYGR